MGTKAFTVFLFTHCLFIFLSSTAFSATSTGRPNLFTVESLSFNFAGSGAIALKDNTRDDDDENITAPEYLREVHNYPAAFPRGSRLKVSARFSTKGVVRIVELFSDVFERKLVRFTNGMSQTVQFTSKQPMDYDVGTHDVPIRWRYCNVNNTGIPSCNQPAPLVPTWHEIHITHAPPAGTPPFFEQLVEWSGEWTKNATTDEEIIQGCFDGIWNLGALGYRYEYPFYERTGDKIDDILDFHMGACSEWAMFMLRCVEVQGVNAYAVNIVPYYKDFETGELYYEFRVHFDALGGAEGPWDFRNHVFLLYGVDSAAEAFSDPYSGIAYDPSFHLTGNGWGGYEDVLISAFRDDFRIWYANAGYGGGTDDDEVNTYAWWIVDDWNYSYNSNEWDSYIYPP